MNPRLLVAAGLGAVLCAGIFLALRLSGPDGDEAREGERDARSLRENVADDSRAERAGSPPTAEAGPRTPVDTARAPRPEVDREPGIDRGASGARSAADPTGAPDGSSAASAASTETPADGSTPAEAESSSDPGSARSMPTSLRARISFTNECRHPVEVLWQDFEGKPRRYKSLAPGAEGGQDTYVMHLWSFRELSPSPRALPSFAAPRSEHYRVRLCASEGDGVDVALEPDSGFVPSDPSAVGLASAKKQGFDPARVCTPHPIPPPVPPVCTPDGDTGAAVQLTFANDCASEGVALFWVTRQCTERPTAEVAPGAVHQEITYPAHRFRVRWKKTGQLLREFVIGDASALVTACGCGL